MLLAVYSHYMVNDPFERCGPALVFTFMLGGRLVVWYQVRILNGDLKEISTISLHFSDEPKRSRPPSIDHRCWWSGRWIKTGLRRCNWLIFNLANRRQHVTAKKDILKDIIYTVGDPTDQDTPIKVRGRRQLPPKVTRRQVHHPRRTQNPLTHSFRVRFICRDRLKNLYVKRYN